MPLLIERPAWERSRLHLGSTASVDIPDGMPHIGTAFADRLGWSWRFMLLVLFGGLVWYLGFCCRARPRQTDDLGPRS